jgi:CHAD domain-containing protein
MTAKDRGEKSGTDGGGALARLLRAQSAVLTSEIARARRGRPQAVHRARTTSRRLRELLPVAAPDAGADASRARRDARRVTRALGRVREFDVALRVLEELAATERWDERAVSPVREALIARRDRRRAALDRALDDALASRLQARCEAVIDALADAVSPRWARTLATRLRRRAERLDRAIAEAGTLYAPDALHDVRIAVKKLRYALELAQSTPARQVGRLLATLERAQDGLGRWHDLVVLEEVVREREAAESDRDRSAGYAAMLATLARECRVAHARFLAQRTGLVRVIRHVESDIAPALTSRRHSRASEPATAGVGTASARARAVRRRRASARRAS